MSGGAVDLGDAVRVAAELIDAGDLPQALGLLRAVLTGVPLDPARPETSLVDACRLYAGVLASLGETYSATPFSGYAHAAARVLPDPTGIRSLQADVVHAFVLRATGSLSEAVTLHHDLVERFSVRYGPETRPALAAGADLAVALHVAGECVQARQTMHRTYFTHRDVFGSGDDQGIRMLARLGVMTRDCGGFEKAHQYFDTAKSLCGKHLPAAHPLAKEVTALARAGTDAAHVCGERAVAGARYAADVRELFMGAFEVASSAEDEIPPDLLAAPAAWIPPRQPGPRDAPLPQAQPRQAQPREAQPREVPLRQAQSRQAPPSDAPPRQAPPRDAPPRQAPPREAPPREAQPRHAWPPDARPGDARPHDTRSFDARRRARHAGPAEPGGAPPPSPATKPAPPSPSPVSTPASPSSPQATFGRLRRAFARHRP